MATPLTRRALIAGAGAVALGSLPSLSAAAAAAPVAVRDSRYLFNPQGYVAKGTVFTRSVASMPVVQNSATLAVNMDRLPGMYCGASGFGWLKTSVNTSSYNLPIYVVDSRAVAVPTRSFEVELYTRQDPVVHGPRIPCPAHAQPALGGDRAMCIYDIGTGVMREYFGCRPTTTGWKAAAAGYSFARPDLQGLAQTNPAMQFVKGSNSVVMMHNALSQIGLKEIEAGVINHAVSVTFANAAPGFSWPAKQADGNFTGYPLPRQGQWFRLPPDLDVSALNLTPFTAMVARAVQRFGGYGSDKNAWCHAVNVESASTVPGGTTASLLDPLMPRLGPGARSDLINDFPWRLTEWAPVDWKGLDQAAPVQPRWEYRPGDWSRTVEGDWLSKPTASYQPHALTMDGSQVSGKNAAVVWQRKPFHTATATRLQIPVHIGNRQGKVLVSVRLNGAEVASFQSRAPKTLAITTRAGTNDLSIRFTTLVTGGGQNDVVTLGSWIPR